MTLDSVEPAVVLQAFFLLSAITIFTVSLSTTLSAQLVAYGSRAEASPNKSNRISSKNDSTQGTSNTNGRLPHLIETVSRIRVPHAYFLHFYVVSVLSSCFWLYQIVTQGTALKALSAYQNTARSSSMSVEQIVLTSALMAIQGLRRLAESLLLMKPSGSTMWFVHWLLGIAFYLAMGVAVWIEGTGEILSGETFVTRIRVAGPSPKTMLGLPLFFMASGIQHDCHTYLASLPKYTLPTHPIFNSLICPHYSMECLIYVSLAIIAAPGDAWYNETIFSALIFVFVNLSVTASNTKAMYQKQFKKELVDPRWKMIPWLW